MSRTIQYWKSQFRESAIAKNGVAENTAEDHRLHDEMTEAWQQIMAIDGEGEKVTKAFLADESRPVRLWAATQLLAMGDQSAVAILESEATSGGVSGFSAQIVLEQWRDGTLSPPFVTR